MKFTVEDLKTPGVVKSNLRRLAVNIGNIHRYVLKQRCPDLEPELVEGSVKCLMTEMGFNYRFDNARNSRH